MSDPDFTLGGGDNDSPIGGQLKTANGVIPDLTGATVMFHCTRVDDSLLVINKAATIVGDPTDAMVFYSFDDADAAEFEDHPGNYFCEFEVTYSSDRVQTFPNTRAKITMEVTRSLA